MFLDDGFSVIILTNGPVDEDTPLLNLGEQIINAILQFISDGRQLLRKGSF
jgi:hypothetical protein